MHDGVGFCDGACEGRDGEEEGAYCCHEEPLGVDAGGALVDRKGEGRGTYTPSESEEDGEEREGLDAICGLDCDTVFWGVLCVLRNLEGWERGEDEEEQDIWFEEYNDACRHDCPSS